jgi:hypothetical protein
LGKGGGDRPEKISHFYLERGEKGINFVVPKAKSSWHKLKNKKRDPPAPRLRRAKVL